MEHWKLLLTAASPHSIIAASPSDCPSWGQCISHRLQLTTLFFHSALMARSSPSTRITSPASSSALSNSVSHGTIDLS